MNNPTDKPDAAGETSQTTLARYLQYKALSPEERRSVLEDLFVFGKDSFQPFLVRQAVLLVLSTMIATAGLLSDSAAVVIGAMLVAPLMNPVLAAAAAVVMGWPNRFYQALWLVGAMGLGALLLSSLITVLSPELVIIPEQVMARTRPTYYDLLIALAAGAAGAYTITRKESSAIPGVAVAVALLPPLASAGILFTTSEYELGLRAVVLFLTNLVAMVLAGALTFLAVGVSPARVRKSSSVFVKAQIWLFFILTLAICVPLWFYSDKVLFNPQYLAAKSDILQQWLTENDLELVDVDVFRESATLSLQLEGPSPPINIGKLHRRLSEYHEIDSEEGFKIEYSWTQRRTGVWPTEETTIGEVAASLQESAAKVVAKTWYWSTTTYAGGTAASPGEGDSFTLFFDHKGKFEIHAPCGKMTGKYAIRGRALDIEMNRNWISGCRKDETLKVFTGDLERARDVYLQDDSLRITMAGESGTIYFERR
jgi:uncharacterized hydrophobic protein (TIGR00271 family)